MRVWIHDRFLRDRMLVILAVAGVLAASWAYAPYVDRGPVVCVLHGVAGLPCPACGLTHAFCDLAHGRLASAAARNSIAFPLFALFLAAGPTAAVEIMRRRRLGYYRFMYSARFAYVLGGVFALYHVSRTAVWCFNGQLYACYFTTSWTYPLWRRILG